MVSSEIPNTSATALMVKKGGCRDASGFDLAQRFDGNAGVERYLNHASVPPRRSQEFTQS